MENPFLNLTLMAENLLMRAVGKRLVPEGVFVATFPEQKFSEMMRNTFKRIEEKLAFPFGVRFRRRWLRSTSGNYANDIETSFASMWLRHKDPALAFELIENFTMNASDGRISSEMNPITKLETPSYPWLVSALTRWTEISYTRTTANKLFSVFSRNADYLSARCRREDGLYHIPNVAWFDHEPTTAVLRRADPGARQVFDRVQLVGFNSLMVCNMRSMSRLALLLGNSRDSRKFEALASNLSKEIHIALWDESQGGYFDRSGDTRYEIVSVASFLPLAAEIPTRHQAERMVAKLDLIIEELSSLVARHDSAALVYLIIDGLKRYGYRTEASRLAVELARAAVALPSEKSFLPCLVSGVALLESTVGFNRFHDRYVLSPSLPKEWEGGVISVRDGQRTARFTLKPDGNVSVELSGPDMPGEPVIIPNNAFRNVLFEDAGSHLGES